MLFNICCFCLLLLFGSFFVLVFSLKVVFTVFIFVFFFFNHKTAYEMRISDCSSDVCSSDLLNRIDGIGLYNEDNIRQYFRIFRHCVTRDIGPCCVRFRLPDRNEAAHELTAMQENISPEPIAGIIEDARVFYENERFYSIDEGIARKRPTIGYLFGLIGWLSRWSAGNALLIAAVILFYRGIRLPRPGPVFQLGLSFNNDRMFRLIHEIGRAHV